MRKVVEQEFCDVAYLEHEKLVQADYTDKQLSFDGTTVTLDLSKENYDRLMSFIMAGKPVTPEEPKPVITSDHDWRTLLMEASKPSKSPRSPMFYKCMREFADREGIKYEYNGNRVYSESLREKFRIYLESMVKKQAGDPNE